MNLFSARVALRPRSLTEVLDLAVPFCLMNGKLLGRLALVTLAPLAALAAALRLGADWSWPALWLLLVPAGFVLEGVFTVALGEALFRPAGEVRARAVLLRFARRLPAYLGAQLARAVVLLASAVVVVPPLLLGPAWLFVPEAVLLENAGLLAAARRSRALGWGRGVGVFGLWLAALAAPALAAVMAELLGGGVTSFVLQLGRPLGDLWREGGSAFAVVGLLAATPCVAALRFLGYIDLRTRKEGWDIQLRFVSWVERDGSPGRRAA
jgi:hypothetical protein